MAASGGIFTMGLDDASGEEQVDKAIGDFSAESREARGNLFCGACSAVAPK